MNTVMVVDDDPDVRDVVERYLTREGFKVLAVADGKGMFQGLESAIVDLVILDLMLGEEDGLELARRLRKVSELPIIMLTGKVDEVDRIVGLELGADDYVSKPFSPRELVARVRSVLRRAHRASSHPEDGSGSGETARFGEWELDHTQRTLRSDSQGEIPLTSGEFNLLAAFVSRPGRVLTRDMLLDLLDSENVFDRSIDVQVLRLRRKIEEDPQDPQVIKTVRGTGYVFASTVTWGDDTADSDD